MTRPEWWLTPVANDVLALCEHLAARPSNSNPDHIDDFIAPSGDDDLKRLIAIAEDQHFVRTEPKWADGGHSHDPVLITPSGLRHVETVHEHRDRRKNETGPDDKGSCCGQTTTPTTTQTSP